MLTRRMERVIRSPGRLALIAAAVPLMRMVALAILAIVLVTVVFPALVAAQAAAF